MSRVAADEAQAIFEALPAPLRWGSLHPRYVAADAVRDGTLEPVFFCHREGADIWLHGGHRAAVPASGHFDLQSPYGYGGPLSNCDDQGFVARASARWSAWCREAGIVVEFLRFHPMLENWRHTLAEVFDDRATVAVELGAVAGMTCYEGRTRTVIRNASRKLRPARRRDDVPAWLAFATLYRAAMRNAGASAFYLFDDAYFLALRASGGGFLLGLDEPAGGFIAGALFLDGAAGLEYHLAAAEPAARATGAASALLHHALVDAGGRGSAWAHLGGGTDARADNPLLRFKRGFSRHERRFRIGRWVHDAPAYARLARDWRARTGTEPKRVLFYRD